VHSLRYALAYGSHAGAELQRQGHAYLGAAPVLLTALLALGAGELIRAAARGDRHAGAPAPLLRVWALAAVALVGIFGIQELLEGMVAAGHASGLQAVVGGGGWLAAPLSVAFGLLFAVLGRAAHAVLAGTRLRLAAPLPAGPARSWSCSIDAAPIGARLSARGRGPPALAG
jgi:hypothetical protein